MELSDGRSYTNELSHAITETITNEQGYSAWVNDLPKEKRLVILLLDMDAQVCNGGFEQYYGNDYFRHHGRAVRATLEGLAKEEAFPLAGTLLDIFKRASVHMQRLWDIDKGVNSSWMDDDEHQDEYDIEAEHLDAIDSAFYGIKEAFRAQFEIYLRRRDDIPTEEIVINELGDLLKSADADLEPEKMKKPSVQLTGTDGNAFMLVGRCVRALKKAGRPPEDIERFRKEAMSSDYHHLLCTAMEWFDVS